MIKTKNKEIKIILEFIISIILIKCIIGLFNITNNSVYTVISVGLLMYALNTIIDNRENVLKKVIIVATNIYSILFSAVIVIQSKIIFNNDVGLSYKENIFRNFEIKDIFRFITVFCVAYIISLFIITFFQKSKFTILETKKECSKKLMFVYWLIFTAIIAGFYMVYLLTYAPGSVLGDSLATIAQGLGNIAYNNHHPILYSIFTGIFMKIGENIGNVNIGVMLYSITQLLIISCTISYFLVWLKKHGVKLQYILLTLLFFIANTIFASYSIIMWKDPLFSAFIFLIILYFYDIIESKGEVLESKLGIFKFIILTILIAFFRNNGFLIVIVNYIVLLIAYRKKLLVFNIINTITIITILLIQGPGYKLLGIISPFEESIGIPLQQIGRTIVYDGKISEEQKEFLYKVLPEEEWKKSYTPCIADTIKWNPNANLTFLRENKSEFIKTWLKMLPNNLDNYIKAYFMSTYGFWSLETKNEYGFVDTYIIENDYGIHHKDIINEITGRTLADNFSTPDFIGAGTIIWIMAFSVVLLVIENRKKYIIVLVPGFVSWLTIMLATPVAFSLRYVFMLAYALPFSIMLPFMCKKVDNSKD